MKSYPKFTSFSLRAKGNSPLTGEIDTHLYVTETKDCLEQRWRNVERYETIRFVFGGDYEVGEAFPQGRTEFPKPLNIIKEKERKKETERQREKERLLQYVNAVVVKARV